MHTYHLWEIAQQAIDTADARMAEGLLLLVQRRHGLNALGLREYLESHGVNIDAWDELTEAI